MRFYMIAAVLLLSLPGWAQKNVLPATRALGVPAVKITQGAVRAELPAALLRRAPSAAVSTAVSLNAINLPHVMVAEKSLKKSLNQRVMKRLSQLDEKKALENDRLLREIDKNWEANPEFIYRDLYDVLYTPMRENSVFALQNNQIVLSASKNLLQKAQWLKSRANLGTEELGYFSSKNVIRDLARETSDKDIIFLGEFHYIPDIQRAVGQLMYALQEQNPGRRIVMFTEFVDMPIQENRSGRKHSLSSYYVRGSDFPKEALNEKSALQVGNIDYAPQLFETLLEDRFEIYPLEDRKLCSMIYDDEKLMCGVQVSALAITLRNKSWARRMEYKMAEIRQTDPDALFVVYAGMAHTSWLMPYALPKFFANEKTAVVEISVGGPSGLNTLCGLWDKKHPYFHKKSLFYWKGQDRVLLGKQTGFDYALVLP